MNDWKRKNKKAYTRANKFGGKKGRTRKGEWEKRKDRGGEYIEKKYNRPQFGK